MALMKLLLLLLGLVAVNSDSVSLQKRIIGGHDCRDDERQYHVKITVDGNYVCGGSLISNQWVLTAAHCVTRGYIIANLGGHPRSGRRQIEFIAQTEFFGPNHDIAMVRLRNRATIRPVQLPDCRNRLRVGDTVQLAGYAATMAGRNFERVSMPMAVHLQCVDMNVAAFHRHLTRGHIFTVEAPLRDACYGDSGGGVVRNNMIYGVISAVGVNACQTPAVMMDVCQYMPWINQVLARP